MPDSHKVFHNADEIIDNLFTLDYLCKNRDVTADLLILGGAGIALLMEINDHSFRITRDIDVNLLDSSDEQAILSTLKELNIDIVGGVMELPPMEDFRIKHNHYQLNLDFSAIRVFLPSPELLACAKLFSKRGKDLEDLRESNLLNICDKVKLLEFVEDYKQYMLNPDDKFVNVHELVHILEAKGI